MGVSIQFYSSIILVNLTLNPVPVYDGRRTATHAAFSFSDEDWAQLSRWPLYKHELPKDALIATGYIFTTFSGSSKTCLSPNLHFVILLGLSHN